MRRTAALIVGGGPAGSAAAITLARGGARPLLIERSREPQDALCGGFLSWDTLRLLGGLGVAPEALGAAAVHRLRLFAGRHRVEAALPHAAAGLSRRHLDHVLLAIAEKNGVRVERGLLARHAEAETRTLAVDGETIKADAVFLATGKHELRGLNRPREAAGRDPALGMRQRFVPSPAARAALHEVIELHLFDGGYAGLVLQEGDAANLCLSVTESRFRKAGATPERLWASIIDEAPLLGDRFAGAAQWQTISRIPYGWRARRTSPGIFRLGDQAAVIPSLAGDGIAIALASGAMAAQTFLRLGADGADAFQKRFAARAARPIATARLLRAIAERPYWATALLPWVGRIPALPAFLALLTRIDR